MCKFYLRFVEGWNALWRHLKSGIPLCVRWLSVEANWFSSQNGVNHIKLKVIGQSIGTVFLFNGRSTTDLRLIITLNLRSLKTMNEWIKEIENSTDLTFVDQPLCQKCRIHRFDCDRNQSNRSKSKQKPLFWSPAQKTFFPFSLFTSFCFVFYFIFFGKIKFVNKPNRTFAPATRPNATADDRNQTFVWMIRHKIL